MNAISFDEFLALCDGVIDLGGGRFQALCPCHNDRNPSLHFERGVQVEVVAYCHVCRDAAPFDRILEALRTGTWATDHKDRAPVRRIPWGPCVAVHPYRRADGSYAYDKLRFRFTDPQTGVTHKQTPYRRTPPGSDPGEVIHGRGDETPLLYNLPEIAAAEPSRTIFCFEGESDVDAAKALGFTATCTDGGAWPPGTEPGNKWRDAFEAPLHGFERVVICRDNDRAGQQYAEHWASRLHGKVGTVRILTLPRLKEKGDFRDWIAGGGTAEEFVRLANDAPIWTPKTSSLRVYSYGDLLAMQFPPERFLVDPLVPLGGFTALCGKGGRWKTWFMDYFALCVAAQRCFLNTFPTRPGRVLILALEGGLREHHRRIEALSRGLSISGDIPLFTYEGPFTAEDPKQREQLAALIRDVRPDLLAVDHLRAMFGGIEDDSERARNIEIFVREMQAVHPSTWFALAHEGKNVKGIRGSSAQEHNLDSLISIDRKQDIGTLTHDKLRNGKEARPFDFRFVGPEEPGGAGFVHLGERGEEDSAASAATSEAALDATVEAELGRAGGRIMRPDLLRRLNVSDRKEEHQIDRSVARLEKRKRLSREPQGKYVAFVLNGQAP